MQYLPTSNRRNINVKHVKLKFIKYSFYRRRPFNNFIVGLIIITPLTRAPQKIIWAELISIFIFRYSNKMVMLPLVVTIHYSTHLTHWPHEATTIYIIS